MSKGYTASQSRTTVGNSHDRSKPTNVSGWTSSYEKRPRDSAGTRNERNIRDECYKCEGKGHYAVVCPTKDHKFTLMCEDEIAQQERVANNLVVLET